MPRKRSERFAPFGGNKRSGQRNQLLRDHANDMLAVENRNAALTARVTQLELTIGVMHKPPMGALERIIEIPTRAAIELGVVDPIVAVHRWVADVRSIASGKPQEVG